MTVRTPTRHESRLVPTGPQPGPPTLAAHHHRHGPAPLPLARSGDWGERLLDQVERAGLTGRGGGGFPASKKLSLARSGARPVLVANAMEGEPASRKDRFLVASAPHLVLDGAELVAAAVDASRIVLCVPEDSESRALALAGALAERAAERRPAVPIEIRRLPGRYVAGEESALVAGAAGRLPLPVFRPDKSVPLRIGRRAALVHNIETLAHIALIARHGADWFAAVGAPEAPGTCLVTVGGAVSRPGVLEVATGTPIGEILDRARPTGDLQAVLVGGYGGTWLSGADAATAYAPAALRPLGASMGAGVLVALTTESCGIRETERIARFMAAESAGQCGPCLFGLPALADDLRALADGAADGRTLDRLLERCGAVAGRGACRHPDGVVRMVESALAVFAPDLADHRRGAPCAASAGPSVLAFPGAPPEKGAVVCG